MTTNDEGEKAAWGQKPPAIILTPGPATISITATSPTLQIKFSAEHWQFFAFVFGAVVALAFELVDELPVGLWKPWAPRWAAKCFVFGVFGYLLLFNLR